MKPLKLKLTKPMYDDLHTLAFKREESMFGLILAAIKEFLAQAKANGEL